MRIKKKRIQNLCDIYLIHNHSIDPLINISRKVIIKLKEKKKKKKKKLNKKQKRKRQLSACSSQTRSRESVKKPS